MFDLDNKKQNYVIRIRIANGAFAYLQPQIIDEHSTMYPFESHPCMLRQMHVSESYARLVAMSAKSLLDGRGYHVEAETLEVIPLAHAFTNTVLKSASPGSNKVPKSASAESVREATNAIHDASEKGNYEKAKALLKDNPDLVFSKDNIDGRTPLHKAAFHGQRDVAALLLDYGADVSAKLNDGETPLHFAAMFNHRDVAKLLLAHGADVNAKLNNGDTPLDSATSHNNEDVVDLLRQHGDDE